MTWRAFIIGLVAVVAVALLDPYTSFNRNFGWNTQGHLPVAAVLLLVVIGVGMNGAIKLVRRRAALRQPELLLIWCMLIVGCVVPSNLMRFWFPVMAAPPYLARRPDIGWRDTALKEAPAGLLLTKDPASLAAERYFEGWPAGEGRVPWRLWLVPMGHWAVLMAFFFLATFFLCAMLRRQWVDRERLQFPLARVPMEFTEGSGGRDLLPALFSNGAFLMGLGGAALVWLLRAAPALAGADRIWHMRVPFQDVLQDTPLAQLYLVNFNFNWVALGLAYLVPGDVSMSVWFFFLFGRLELLTSSWLGSPLHYGGSSSPLMRWQRPGAYVAFTIGSLYLARHHLWDVLRRAFFRRSGAEDSAEPVAYSLAFWGFVVCSLGAVGWLVYYGVGPTLAVLVFLLLMCTQFVHARVVAQSGLYRTAPLDRAPALLDSLTMGRLFTPRAAIVTNMQYTSMIGGNNSMLGPAAIHAFRISEVFGRRRRRLLLPILIVALTAAMAASSWTCLHQAYSGAALNYSNRWAVVSNPRNSFDMAHLMIRQPGQALNPQWLPFGLGMVLTGFVMFMRARFFWWPVHAIGLLALSDYGMDRMWFSFLLGWLVKAAILKFGTGRMLRQARFFFIGFIIGECSFYGAWSLASFLTAGKVPGAGGWI